MKYSNFVSRALCFVILLAALSQYQIKASLKAQEEAENAAAVAEAEEYNREIRRQMSNAENASPYNDGTFEGQADGFGGPIQVKVTIDGGDITKIDVLSAAAEDPAYYTQAVAVLDQILQTQGVNVDTVTGATFSSTGLINAVNTALRSALK